MDFRDRHVVVTGGTGALGTALVGTLLDGGAVCHVPWVKESELRRFPYRSHQHVRLVECDLTDEATVARLFEGAPRLWASIHVAGGFDMAPVAKTDKTALLQQIDTNLVSCFLCCGAAVRIMARTGAGGRIVNVSARPGLEWRGGAGMAAYTVAKAGVAALTLALAEEVASQGILVNAVAPSIIDTPANREAMPKSDFSAWPKVEDVAATILFLASGNNRVTRGAIVPVYGKA
jgi:NAD(P)-dependent dehydrogenase (short-subunit alcohol dehydrogenase family)